MSDKKHSCLSCVFILHKQRRSMSVIDNFKSVRNKLFKFISFSPTHIKDDNSKLHDELTKNSLTSEETRERKIVVDTETTGLSNENDEILQLSIIDADTEEVIFNDYFKPMKITSWEEAQKINEISPEMVSNKPFFIEKANEIQQIMNTVSTAIGYNTNFDLGFLKSHGIKGLEEISVIDVMEDFAPIYGEYSEKRQNYKWQKLSVCAEYYEYIWDKGTAHNSLSDCYATLHCYKKMQEEKEIMQGNGYSGWSISNNVLDAYNNSEMPLSKWSKTAILERIVYLINDEEISIKFDLKLLKRMNLQSLKDVFLSNSGWHHTSAMYNKTKFYKVNSMVINEMTDEKIKEIINGEKQIKKEEPRIEYAKCKFLVWSGSRKHPKSKEYVENGIIKDNWFYRSDGSKKNINANGFQIIKKLTLNEYNAEQTNKNIDISM